MKLVGAICKVGKEGRILLPMAVRKQLNVQHGQYYEVFTNGEDIILKKHNSVEHICCFCGSNENVVDLGKKFPSNSRHICKDCKKSVLTV